ncbi:MAG: alanine:cation symporter family protein [Paramuribaculum sp.]|nr:alanine:cation symporter family protein [Paramuribaculum sp.]
MLESLGYHITTLSDVICGLPLFLTLIGGGVWLFFTSHAVSIHRLPYAIKAIKTRSDSHGEINSLQALASVVAGTIGMGNIAGVTIAIAMGGPGAIFWMWISALVGMCTKYHEGVLSIMYRSISSDGTYQGGTMHIIQHGLGKRWIPMAKFFAIAGMFGTLCIMNANQLTEATIATASNFAVIESPLLAKLLTGITISLLVAIVVLGGITRISRVATVLVPFMVATYFIMVLYIIVSNIDNLGHVFSSIFTEAFSLDAGWGALAGIAIIGARRAALVNDAGIGTASIMHGKSSNNEPVREGLVAMLGPAIDSGFVCTLTAIAVLLCLPSDYFQVGTIQGLEMALKAFGNGIPYGQYLLMVIVACFALSSMFSYSFYGQRCAAYLMGERGAKVYTYLFISSLVLFSVVPLKSAVGLCDLFYAFMAFPTMLTLIMLRKKVREQSQIYFKSHTLNKHSILKPKIQI